LDVHYTAAEPTDEERDAVDALLGPSASGWTGGQERTVADRHFALGGRAAREQRHLLLPALHALADRVGWISEGALNHVCRRLTIPPAEAFGVASFYGLFSTKPRPPRVVHVCDDLACLVNADLCGEVERSEGAPGKTERRSGATWLRSPCLGLCERAPAAMLSVAGANHREEPIAPARTSDIVKALDGPPDVRELPRSVLPQHGDPKLRLLRRIGNIDPASLDDYRAAGGYASLRRAFELGPSGVIREVLASKLLGRGGAAFPTGRKWDAVAREPERPHYVVCNADESEPGTFKDRILMEEDPFAVIEAMTVAAFAGGCERGFIYIRGEYPRAQAALEHAIAEARRHGLLGDEIMGRGLCFDIEIRRGAGAYICGEETALFNSIEGYRGEPRNKPPFPVQKGLFGKPTTWKRSSMCRTSWFTAARHTRRSARPTPPAQNCSAFLDTPRDRACTKCRSAPRCGNCSTSPAACAPASDCKRCCSAVRPARSPRPMSWIRRSPSRAFAPRMPRWVRA
jgi:NADH-quinone oxidoreductase subunit F